MDNPIDRTFYGYIFFRLSAKSDIIDLVIFTVSLFLLESIGSTVLQKTDIEECKAQV